MGSDHPLELQVTLLGEPELVVPAEPVKENQGEFFLSNLDQNIAVMVETLYFFQAQLPQPHILPVPEDDPNTAPGNGDNHDGATENGDIAKRKPAVPKRHPDPARVLKDALAKLLVFYYPVTGRLGISKEGKLDIKLTGDGVVFVEAEANLSLAELGYDVSKPNVQVSKKLVYAVPGAANILQIPPMVIQVTKFKCGGWVLGLSNNHCLFDGVGAMNFVNSWAELARGEKALSVSPVLDRSIIRQRNPPEIRYPHGEFAEIEDLSEEKNLLLQDEGLENAFFWFTADELEALKKAASVEETVSPTAKVTTFESLAAHIWRARTRAMGMKGDQLTKLLFAVDGRNRLEPPLPQGFVGNGIALAYATTTSSELTQRPLSHAVGLVKDAIAMITGDYIRSAIDFFEVTRARPALVATLVITTWSRLEFHTTNFGWGEPVQTGPANLPEREAVLFLSHGTERKSINVLISLPPAAMDIFRQEVRKL